MYTRQRLSTASLICSFLIGVILFVSFGRNWLTLESMLIFLAGLGGIAVAVLAFGIASISRNSNNKGD
jgi:hypothetical protein